MKLIILPWLLIGILLNAGAQLLLKAGSQRISDTAFTIANIFPMGIQLATNPFILIGIIFYVVSMLIWIGVLSRVDVSVAYPMISLGYIVNAIAAYYLFGEALSLSRVTGLFIILVGVYLVAQS